MSGSFMSFPGIASYLNKSILLSPYISKSKVLNRGNLPITMPRLSRMAHKKNKKAEKSSDTDTSDEKDILMA